MLKHSICGIFIIIIKNERKGDNVKKSLLFSLTVVLSLTLFSGCGAKKNQSIAVIRNLVQDDHTIQFLEGAVEEGKQAGYNVDTFVSGGDDEKTQKFLEDAINKNYEGIILSHGKESYSYELLKKAADKGIQIVTFDTVVNGDIDGLTQTAQNDRQLAELSLTELATGFEKPAKIVKIWYSGGLLPFNNRNILYQQMETEGLIQTVGEIDLADLDNVQGDVEAALDKLLGDGVQMDGVWASWDEMAKGALAALTKTQRTDVKLVSIDISAADIELMENNSTIWQATAAVDAKMIGSENMKLLIEKLKGEQTEPDVLFEGTLYTIQDGRVQEAER